jgi:hypothetical protein
MKYPDFLHMSKIKGSLVAENSHIMQGQPVEDPSRSCTLESFAHIAEVPMIQTSTRYLVSIMFCAEESDCKSSGGARK